MSERTTYGAGEILMPPMSELTEEQQFLRDNDSLYVLPLRYVPLETAALRRGRLVKNFALEPVVEVFRYPEFGRGYFLVQDLAGGRTDSCLGWKPDDGMHEDGEMLQILGCLDSFDVYTLRIRLRELGIAYEKFDYLKLSDEMRSELRVYMHEFTLPLLETIFRDNDIESADDVIELFRSPPDDKARANLDRFARRLGIRTEEIAEFLEMFADVYLAICYYRRYADEIGKEAQTLFGELEEILVGLLWREDASITTVCGRARELIAFLLAEVNRRLDVYDAETTNFWKDLDPARFRQLRDLVRESQRTIAGILCGLGVKLAGWRDRFPLGCETGFHSRFEAVQTDLCPGLEKLVRRVRNEDGPEESQAERPDAGVEMVRVVA